MCRVVVRAVMIHPSGVMHAMSDNDVPSETWFSLDKGDRSGVGLFQLEFQLKPSPVQKCFFMRNRSMPVILPDAEDACREAEMDICVSISLSFLSFITLFRLSSIAQKHCFSGCSLSCLSSYLMSWMLPLEAETKRFSSFF